jgi:hypothetical protein
MTDVHVDSAELGIGGLETIDGVLRDRCDLARREGPAFEPAQRPACGPSAAETSSATENAANTVAGATARSRAIGVASTAGR